VSVRATLELKVKAGRGDEFVEAWKKIAERVRREPGNLRQSLIRDPEDRDSFEIASDWESREAFTAFERSPEQDELTAPIRELRESARMAVHELVEYVEGKVGEET
jgi:heme-degrading monooxygenase HmoA